MELSVFDAFPDPTTAIRRAESFDLVFGPYGSGPARAAIAATTRTVFNHGGARVPRAPNVISVLAPASTYFHGAVRAFAPRVGSVAVVHGDTGFARAVGGGAEAETRRHGLAVTRTVWPEEPPDAELLLVAADFETEVAAARRLLPGSWRVAGFVGAGVDEVLAELGSLREGLIGPAQWMPEVAVDVDEGPGADEFLRVFPDPPYPAVQAFAAGVIASRCLRDAGSTEDSALVAAARALDCRTLFGRFRLDPETGAQVGHEVLTVQWQGGRRRVIWPARD